MKKVLLLSSFLLLIASCVANNTSVDETKEDISSIIDSYSWDNKSNSYYDKGEEYGYPLTPGIQSTRFYGTFIPGPRIFTTDVMYTRVLCYHKTDIDVIQKFCFSNVIGDGADIIFSADGGYIKTVGELVIGTLLFIDNNDEKLKVYGLDENDNIISEVPKYDYAYQDNDPYLIYRFNKIMIQYLGDGKNQLTIKNMTFSYSTWN